MVVSRNSVNSHYYILFTMDEFLKTLKDKEKELQSKLEANPLFKQLELLRTTISAFQNGHSANGSGTVFETPTPEFYNPETMTWKGKIMFALRQLGEATISEIAGYLKTKGEPHGEEWLEKRVSVMLSLLKKENVGVKKVGKQSKYFIK